MQITGGRNKKYSFFFKEKIYREILGGIFLLAAMVLVLFAILDMLTW